VVDDEVELDALALLVEAGVELDVETEVVGVVESDVEMMLVVVVSVEPSTLVVVCPDDKKGTLGKTI
jgi:hypothetical protein